MMTTESFAADRTNLFNMTFRFLSGAMLSLLAAIGRTSPVVVMTFKGSEFEDLATNRASAEPTRTKGLNDFWLFALRAELSRAF